MTPSTELVRNDWAVDTCSRTHTHTNTNRSRALSPHKRVLLRYRRVIGVTPADKVGRPG